MGRKDSYTYYSEAGQAASGETPGAKEKTAREKNSNRCSSCGERSPSAVERKGDLRGDVLCDECAEDKQSDIEHQKTKSVVERIREAREE